MADHPERDAFDTLRVPFFIRTAHNEKEFLEWSKLHPDNFHAGYRVPDAHRRNSGPPPVLDPGIEERSIVPRPMHPNGLFGRATPLPADLPPDSSSEGPASEFRPVAANLRTYGRAVGLWANDTPELVGHVGSARLSPGSADMVAGPFGDTPPTEQIRQIEQTILELTEEVKTEVNATIPPKMPSKQLGTLLHLLFAQKVERAIKEERLPKTIKTEQSYINGSDADYGEKGSLRTDVVLTDGSGNVIAIWDYKTGAGSYISPRRVEALKVP